MILLNKGNWGHLGHEWCCVTDPHSKRGSHGKSAYCRHPMVLTGDPMMLIIGHLDAKLDVAEASVSGPEKEIYPTGFLIRCKQAIPDFNWWLSPTADGYLPLYILRNPIRLTNIHHHHGNKSPSSSRPCFSSLKSHHDSPRLSITTMVNNKNLINHC